MQKKGLCPVGVSEMQLVDGINGNVNSQNESSKEGADPEGRNNRYPALEEEGNLFLD